MHIDIDSELACRTAFYRSLYELLEREFAIPINDAERKRYDRAAKEANLSRYEPSGVGERLETRRIRHPNGKEYELEFLEEMYVPGPLRQVMPGMMMTPVSHLTYRVHGWVFSDGQYMFEVLSQPYNMGEREQAVLSVTNRIDELLGRDDWADQSLYFADE